MSVLKRCNRYYLLALIPSPVQMSWSTTASTYYLEENKHRGNATSAKNDNACPKRVLQQSFFAKSLVFGTTKGRSGDV